MSDENVQVATEAVEAAPASVETATTEAANDSPGEQEPRVFSQEELDAAIGKRLSIERRRWEREQQERAEQAQRPDTSQPPRQENYRTAEGYIDALADYKAELKTQERQAKQQRSTVVDAYQERESAAREKYNDFHRVAYANPDQGGPAISEGMAAAIMDSEIGPEIAYYLGKNVDESYRIHSLNDPIKQAREIGKIEAKLSTNPPAKPVSSAPAPIKPVNASRASTGTYDTSDPRSLKMSPSEWINQRNRELAKRNQ